MEASAASMAATTVDTTTNTAATVTIVVHPTLVTLTTVMTIDVMPTAMVVSRRHFLAIVGASRGSHSFYIIANLDAWAR